MCLGVLGYIIVRLYGNVRDSATKPFFRRALRVPQACYKGFYIYKAVPWGFLGMEFRDAGFRM